MNAAMAFANQHEFAEADRLAAEAMAIEKGVRHPLDNFSYQLSQIRRMENAPAQ